MVRVASMFWWLSDSWPWRPERPVLRSASNLTVLTMGRGSPSRIFLTTASKNWRPVPVTTMALPGALAGGGASASSRFHK